MQKIIEFSKEYVFKIRWRLFQQLSLIPKYENSSISDLFYWVVDDEWETFFDLSPIIKLFKQTPSEFHEKILILIFDDKGKIIESKRLELNFLSRKTLKISEFFQQKVRGYGTFAIFHLGRPYNLKKMNSYISERGYLSFSYKGSKVRSYVHGNMDSVALTKKGEIDYLGNAFLWNREYCLQYLLGCHKHSRIILVNSYKKKLKYLFRLVNVNNRECMEEKEIYILPGGVETYEIPSTIKEKVFLIIAGKSIMARPVVITYYDRGVDIFHG